MLKRVLVLAILCIVVFQGTAFATIETQGDVVFRDALYGAAIGAILGGAVYLADKDDLATKIGIGVAVGTIGGLFFGVMETRSVVEIEKNEIKFAVPTPSIERRGDGIMYSTSLVKFHLD